MNAKLIVAAAASLVVVSACAAERELKIEDLPAAVRVAVERQVGKDGKIRGLDSEKKGAATVYEAELTVDGRRRDVSFDETGGILEIEEPVALDALPEAVKAAILKAAGKGRVVLVESLSDAHGLVAYEAQISHGRRRTEVRVDPQGRPAPKP